MKIRRQLTNRGEDIKVANELKATVINLKSLSQNIPDPITVGAGDASGRKLRVIFTQEAAAQFTPNTKVYLSWRHQEKDIKGYNIFTEIIDEENEDFPPTWEISYPKSMLYEGHVLACIEIVDEISIATSVNFTINILIDPNNGKTFVESDDYTDFQNFIINLNTLSDQMQEQMINYENEFEQMQLDFTNFSDLADTVAEIQNQNEEIQNSLDGINLSEIQEFVENYEEPTLSLGDNDVTTNIIADKAVTLNKLSDEVTQKINTKNSINLIKMSNGTTVTAHDAYIAPPLGLTVYGKSVQDGTPTPSSPVAINSVESVAAVFAGGNVINPSILENGSINATTGDEANTLRIRTKNSNRIPVSAGQTLVLAGGTSPKGAVNMTVEFYTDTSNTRHSVSGWRAVGGSAVVPNGVTNIRIVFRAGADATITTADFSDITVVIVDTSTPIDLQGHELRSLPDGTHDELTVDADGHVTLVQRVGAYTIDGTESITAGDNVGSYWRSSLSNALSGAPSKAWRDAQSLCTHAPYASGWNTDALHQYTDVANIVITAAVGSATALLAAYVGATVIYPLATPVTIPLGTVTLPELPAPDLAVWAATDPITNISLTYNRDIGIVINNIEEALNNLLNS